MNPDDPFAGLDDGDRTIVKPTPGGRRPAAGGPAPAAPGRVAARPGGLSLPPRSGLNPLENAASALLALMARLRNSSSHPDPDGLRAQSIEELKAFEVKARSASASSETVHAARYVLCTAVDEAVLNTPWGSESAWGSHSLLSTFHNETWGGEKFFVLLDRLLKDPGGNLHLLELMYLCLALGFQGRYRVMEGGLARLEEKCESLYRAVRAIRGDFERELSPHWQGVTDRRNPLLRHVPLWVLSAAAATLLLAIYVGFSYWLSRSSDPVFEALHGLGRDLPSAFARPSMPAPIPPPAPASADLRGFLAEEVRQGLVTLVEKPGRTTIRIRGDDLFGSGSATVNRAYHPLLDRIAEALKTVPGQVLITGHTDNVPIFTPRFPSNWDLSQARAEAVLAILAADTGTPGRFTAEGRSDTEPLVPNTGAANRAQNRRVEITLLAQVRRS